MRIVHVFCFRGAVVKGYGEIYRITEHRETLKLNMIMWFFEIIIY